MASESYNTLCNEVSKHVLKRLEKNHEKDYYFAPDGTAKEVLDNDTLRRVFRSLGLQSNLTEDELASRVDARDLHSFLAVLMFTGCSIEAARTFTTQLVVKDPWPQDFWSLPVAHEKLLSLFGEKVTPHKIMGQQACFCPVVIHKGVQLEVSSPKGRLPYLEQKRRAEGSFGKVYEVKIARGHFHDPQTGLSNREPMTLARKDYTTTPEFSGEVDHEIMKQILSCKRTCNNIVENYGVLVTGSTYSLFMPLAICDLSAYMMKHHRTPPTTTAEKAKIILSAQGLASGLHFLHNCMKTPTGDELVCYHMDLKPSNILIFRETIDGQEQYVWKISDFGMSRVRIRHRERGSENERDFNLWFLRKPPPAPTLEPTRALHGEGTYLAPESISAIPSMKTSSDVWSLGCVLSVVFVYLEEGSDGVEQYQEARLRHHNADGIDRFFLRDRGFLPSSVHPLVHKWHTRLIDKASQRSPDEGEALKFMLRHLEHSVLQVDQSKRCGVKEVKERLRITYGKYSNLKTPDGSNREGKTQREWSIMTKLRSIGHGANSSADRPVDEWFLDAPDASKSCEISPKGDLIAFWTDTKILLYTSQSLKERHLATTAGDCSLKEDAGCFWKTVALTEKYLIASTTGASFQCYVFDLKRGVAVDPSLNHFQIFTLPHYPEITKLAISPSSKTIACILRDQDDDQNHGSLFFAPVTSVNEGRSFGQLDWPARDVMQLHFSNEDDIYIIVRPRLTVRSRKHEIPIIHVCRRTKKLQPLIFESNGLDSSATAGLFTTFAPFRHKPACAVVTREKQLHIRSLVADPAVPSVQLDFKSYRVLKLIMGRRDEKLYAIGKPSASHRMLLLEIPMPGPTSNEVSVRELAQLPNLSYDAHFTEVLSDEREENYVLIASLASANQRAAIHRIRLLN